MGISNQDKNKHLLSRAGFGVSINDIPHLGKSNRKFVKEIMKAARGPLKNIAVKNPFVEDTLDSMKPENKGDMTDEAFKISNAAKGKAIRKQSDEDIKQLSIDWMHEMVYSDARLKEKMSLFWHGHFACRVNNSLYQEQLLKIIRTNALGNFGTLLKEVSKSPAMLIFLNGQQNKKKHPNENFGREVMELFTLGRGNYTEQDVKEIARAFTGWEYNRDGIFVFNEKTHDANNKTFLGQTGDFNGDDALSIILQQQQTAKFITEKIYRFFVNEQVDEVHVKWLSERFYKSNYDIGALMQDIFSSDWFYDDKNRGIQIKSPVAYIAGIRTFLPMTLRNEEVQILLERLLGQWLFNPPNVAGWAGERAWIDSSSLMLRLKIPSLIKNDETIDLKPKSNDDVQMGNMEKFEVGAKQKKKKPGARYQILASIDWTKLANELDAKDKNEILRKLKALLLQTPEESTIDTTILNSKAEEDVTQFTKRVTIEIMSTPEYQLC